MLRYIPNYQIWHFFDGFIYELFGQLKISENSFEFCSVPMTLKQTIEIFFIINPLNCNISYNICNNYKSEYQIISIEDQKFQNGLPKYSSSNLFRGEKILSNSINWGSEKICFIIMTITIIQYFKVTTVIVITVIICIRMGL